MDWQHRFRMLAALNVAAVLAGVAAGGLVASVLALVASAALTLVGVETGPDIGLSIGVFTGLATGGWVAGARSAHSHRFHGMVTGLVLAFVILVVARLGGSPAPTSTVLLLAVISVVVAGSAGAWAGRKRPPDG